MPEDLADKVRITEKAWEDARDFFGDLSRQTSLDKRRDALRAWNQAAREYFSACVEAFLNYQPHVAHYYRNASYAADWLEYVVNHYSRVREAASELGLKFEDFAPGILKFKELQELVRDNQPATATDLKKRFEAINLPIYGFLTDSEQRDGAHREEAKKASEEARKLANGEAERAERSETQAEKTRWFTAGCIFLVVAIAFTGWAFSLGVLTPDRRRLLLWILPLASGFSVGGFSGSISVTARRIIPGLLITGAGGFAVWLITFLLLFPHEPVGSEFQPETSPAQGSNSATLNATNVSPSPTPTPVLPTSTQVPVASPSPIATPPPTATPPTPTPAPTAVPTPTPTPKTVENIGIQLQTIHVFHDMSGQDWRRSNNFSLSTPSNISRLRWVIVEPAAKSAVFSVAHDQWGPDPKRFENVHDGHYSGSMTDDDLYIGGVSGAPGDFTVKVYGE